MRSPIWLRVISDVPPAIDSARVKSTAFDDRAGPGHERVGPEEREPEVGRPLRLLGRTAAW